MPLAMTPRDLLASLALLLLPLASAQWSAMPAECLGRCWEDDNDHPLSGCAPAVLDDVVTSEQADALVRMAEAHAAKHGWTTKRHANYPTTDLPASVLPPESQRIVNDAYFAAIANVRARCGVRADAQLTANDIFLVKYSPGGQPGLHRHRDGSFASFNLMLSAPEDYDGGGTRMWDDAKVRANASAYWLRETKAAREAFLDARFSETETPGLEHPRTPPSSSSGGSPAAARSAWAHLTDAELESILPDRLLRPAAGWDRWRPKPTSLAPSDATLHLLRKGQMLVAGGGNVHEGAPVTRGTRYIIAGFVGMNRHCCSMRYAGWRGLLGFARVYALANAVPDVKNAVPLRDYELYREGREMLRVGAWRLAVGGAAVVALVKGFPRAAKYPSEVIGAYRRRRVRKSLLPSKSYD